MVLFVRAVPAIDTSMLWTMFNFQIQCYDVVVHTKHHCEHYRMLTECQVARSGKKYPFNARHSAGIFRQGLPHGYVPIFSLENTYSALTV